MMIYRHVVEMFSPSSANRFYEYNHSDGKLPICSPSNLRPCRGGITAENCHRYVGFIYLNIDVQLVVNLDKQHFKLIFRISKLRFGIQSRASDLLKGHQVEPQRTPFYAANIYCCVLALISLQLRLRSDFASRSLICPNAGALYRLSYTVSLLGCRYFPKNA